MSDAAEFRKHFPELNVRVNNRPLIYFDNAASSLRPKVVSDRISKFYLEEAANVHRGAHFLSNKGTENFEAVREQVKSYIGATSSEEIIFTRGTTESINLICHGIESQIQEGDEIVISVADHHSNIVPWQQLALRKKAKLVWVDLTDDHQFDFEQYKKLLNNRTKVVTTMWYSNTLGIRFPVENIVEEAKKFNATVCIDAAQAMLHEKINLSKLKIDFLSFSGHKMFAPNGIGVLYGKKEKLERLSPYQYGGSMIERVTKEDSTFNILPYRFEAGTPNVSGVLGLGAAIGFIENCGIDFIKTQEQILAKHLNEQLSMVSDIKIYGPLIKKIPVTSFNMGSLHHSDLGQILDNYGVAVRVGHHCTMPLMKYLGIAGTVRCSLAAYNTITEIDQAVDYLNKAKELLNA